MREKLAFLAFFTELFLAQRGAAFGFHLRHANTPAKLVSYGRHPAATQSLVADSRESGSAHNVLELRDDTNVFTTVLYPSVPTDAPTGVMVPTIVTYTGTFDPTAVFGYQYTPPPAAQTQGTDPSQSQGQDPTQSQGQDPTQPAGQTTQQQPTIVPTPSTTDIPSSQQTTDMPSQHSDQSSMPQSTMSMMPSSQPVMSSRPTSQSRMPSSSPHSTSHSTSSTSSTSSSSTSKSSSSQTSSSASPSGSFSAVGSNSNNSGPDRNPHLSGGAIAGITIGVVAFTAALAALFLWLLSRRNREKVPDSPGIYPQEAYLYDPPISPEGAAAAGGAGGVATATHNIPRAATPEMSSTETEGLLGGAAAAGGALAAGAASRSRRGTGDNTTQQRSGFFSAYAPVNGHDNAVAGPSNQNPNPFADEYRDERGNPNAWPLNPNAPSGLGTPPGSSSGAYRQQQVQEEESGLQSGSQTPRSMYRDYEPSGPAISGVGSSRYERRVSAGPTGVTSPTAGGYNPAMREARRAWGMED